MSNRLLKRHKRQVARARERVKLSEPDVRTAEQLQAAREASQPAGGWRNPPGALYARPPGKNQTDPAANPTADEG